MDQLNAAEIFAIAFAANLASLFVIGIYAYSLIDMHRRGVTAHNVVMFFSSTLFTLTAGYSLHQLLAG